MKVQNTERRILFARWKCKSVPSSAFILEIQDHHEKPGFLDRTLFDDGGSDRSVNRGKSKENKEYHCD